MAQALKDQFDQAWWLAWQQQLKTVFPNLDFCLLNQRFEQVSWQELSLKQRIKWTAETLVISLQNELNYSEILQGLIQIAPNFSGLPGLVMPQVVENYAVDHGLDQFDVSMDALAVFTQYSTAEYAIRPFIEQDSKRTMQQMQAWSLADNPHLRRLASEGCRPRLPWARALNEFKLDPTPIWPILNNLMEDASRYVQKSVANNLNDTAKDHPEKILAFCKSWVGRSASTDWIIKHASRNFLKQRHPEFLDLLGIKPANVFIQNWQNTKQLTIGENLNYQFELVAHNQQSGDLTNDLLGHLRVEIQIGFVRPNNKTYNKVFKLFEANYLCTHKKVNKTMLIKHLSTRKIYPGRHKIQLIVNGEIKHQAWFEVSEPQPI